MRAVIPFDVMQHDLLLDAGEHNTSFDVVLSAFCVERVAPTFKDFKQIVENIVSVLRPSGYLVMTVSIINVMLDTLLND